MTMLPRISGRECVSALEAVGFLSSGRREAILCSAETIPLPRWLSPTIGNWTVALCGASSDMPDWALMIS